MVFSTPVDKNYFLHVFSSPYDVSVSKGHNSVGPSLFTLKNGKQPLIFQKVTYLVTSRIDQIDPKTWLILGF